MVNIASLEAAVKALPGDPDAKAVLGGLSTTLVNIDLMRRTLLTKESQAIAEWIKRIEASWSPMEIEASGIATVIRNAGFAALGISNPIGSPVTEASTVFVEIDGAKMPMVPAEIAAFYERSYLVSTLNPVS